VITGDEIEKAVDWLRASTVPAAEARATRLYLAEWIKTVKAQRQVELMQMGTHSAASAEATATASDEYRQALLAYKAAVEADEKYRFGIAAMEAKIEAWRTMESTKRAEGKAYGA
jgi:hypothetical protein